MSLMLRNGRDPFSLFSRDFFGFEPMRTLGTVVKEAAPASFAPKFEVKETESCYVLRADLPGVKKDALEVTLDADTLIIAGSRDAEDRKDDETYHVYERSYGAFKRAFRLPDMADGEKIDADLSDGVLSVSIPKRAEAKPRKIALK